MYNLIIKKGVWSFHTPFFMLDVDCSKENYILDKNAVDTIIIYPIIKYPSVIIIIGYP